MLLLRSIAASHAGSNSILSPPLTCHICHYLALNSSAIFAKFGRGIERLAAIGGTGERPHFTFRHEYYATHGNANKLKRSFFLKKRQISRTLWTTLNRIFEKKGYFVLRILLVLRTLQKTADTTFLGEIKMSTESTEVLETKNVFIVPARMF